MLRRNSHSSPTVSSDDDDGVPGNSRWRCGAHRAVTNRQDCRRAPRRSFYYKIGGKSMGKRELLIIIAFVVVGAVAYQLTAPPPKPGERGFSLSRHLQRHQARNPRATPRRRTITTTGTIAVARDADGTSRVTARSVPLTVIGEERKDIGYELPVESTGPDEATAQRVAPSSVELAQDDLGSALALSTVLPRAKARQTATLTLRVPRGLPSGSRTPAGSKCPSVAARRPAKSHRRGRRSRGVAGAVTGTHRNGDLTIDGAASRRSARSSSSRAKFRNVRGASTLNARSGECSIARQRRADRGDDDERRAHGHRAVRTARSSRRQRRPLKVLNAAARCPSTCGGCRRGRDRRRRRAYDSRSSRPTNPCG